MSAQPEADFRTEGARGAAGAVGGPPLVIGEGLRIAGSMTCEGELHVDGTVEGDISARAIVVGPHGNVCGTLTAEDVVLRGTVTGIVYACSATLGATAVLYGDLVHEILCIEGGAIFIGACRRPASAPATPLPRRPALLMAPTIEAAPEKADARKEPAPAK